MFDMGERGGKVAVLWGKWGQKRFTLVLDGFGGIKWMDKCNGVLLSCASSQELRVGGSVRFSRRNVRDDVMKRRGVGSKKVGNGWEKRGFIYCRSSVGDGDWRLKIEQAEASGASGSSVGK